MTLLFIDQAAIAQSVCNSNTEPQNILSVNLSLQINVNYIVTLCLDTNRQPSLSADDID